MKFVQMKFIEFYNSMPDFCHRVFGLSLSEYLNDSSYVVRLGQHGEIEVGYESDNWFIN